MGDLKFEGAACGNSSGFVVQEVRCRVQIERGWYIGAASSRLDTSSIQI